VELGPFGVWWSGSWQVEQDPSVDVVSDLESAGYTAIWSTGGFKPGLSSRFERLLSSTKRIVVASGIVNIWLTPAAELGAEVSRLQSGFPGRFLLGLGASHAPLIPDYDRPLSRMEEYLDALDGAEHPVPSEDRVLAALRPRMLELAARRSAGAHPYFVPVEHTSRAREILGSGPLLAPEVTVVLESDPATARALARRFTTGYLDLPNYANNLRSLGYRDEELANGGSDRLVDAVVAWGDAAGVSERLREHLQAGADHVCIQVLSGETGFPLGEYRQLMDHLGGGRQD
jgi:probable F420-dependent oxidoreductase